jgi:4'-phosphopantetheinyl transferase
MTMRWIQVDESCVPEDDDWLGPDEKKVLAGLGRAKRRREWRLGRYAAKKLVSSFTKTDEPARVQVVAAEDGAPDVFVDGDPLDVSLSISHRDGVAACTLSTDAVVGCDLEAVEPRTSRFVADFFTEHESALAERSPGEERDLRVALTWSAKESALKVLRVGLRRDTRDVEVELGDIRKDDGWHPFEATLRPERRLLRGWWRRRQNLVLTVASSNSGVPARAPLELHPSNLP